MTAFFSSANIQWNPLSAWTSYFANSPLFLNLTFTWPWELKLDRSNISWIETFVSRNSLSMIKLTSTYHQKSKTWSIMKRAENFIIKIVILVREWIRMDTSNLDIVASLQLRLKLFFSTKCEFDMLDQSCNVYVNFISVDNRELYTISICIICLCHVTQILYSKTKPWLSQIVFLMWSDPFGNQSGSDAFSFTSSDHRIIMFSIVNGLNWT